MNKAIGLALLVPGIVLIVYGIDASNSVSSDLSRTFTGSPTNKALWLLIGGIGAAIVGAAMTFTGARKINK
jgi:hypothetical protein